MLYNEIIHGNLVSVRSAVPGDAEQTLKLRQDPVKTRYLHQIDDDITRQIKWLEQQNEREGDYFFVVLDEYGKIIGTSGIYDIATNLGQSGRLLSYGNAFQSFEGQMLVIRFAFEYLGLSGLWCTVDKDNQASYKFSRAFGFQFREPAFDEESGHWVKYGILKKANYKSYIEKIEHMIYRRKSSPIMPWDKC